MGSGVLPAATDNTRSMDRLAVIDTAAARKTLASLQVIWTSPTIPEDPMIWRADLDPAIKAKISRVHVQLWRRRHPRGQAPARGAGAHPDRPFKHADNTHLLPVREMEATGQLVEARAKGDPAAMAKAQATLDQIEGRRRCRRQLAQTLQQEVAAERGERLAAVVLPGFHVDVGDAAADLAQVGAGVGGQRPRRAAGIRW